MSNRDLYIEKMKAQLDSWNASIEKLEAQARNAEADAKIKYREQIAELKKRREEAREKLAELREASEGAWHDLQSGIDHAWDAMEQAIKTAMSRFR